MKLTIDDIGTLGDGIAHHDGDTLFVPYTLAGETVEASGKPPRLSLEKVLQRSVERVVPPCPHFGTCGGCAVQHWASAPYLEWKRQNVVEAFAAENLSPEIETCVATETGSRRRVAFSAFRDDDGVVLGFNQRGSQDIVDIETCPILVPEISAHLRLFKQLAGTVVRGREEVRVLVTSCDNGLDIDFETPQDMSEGMIADFVRMFARAPFIRATGNGVVLVEREKPIINFGDTAVPIPPAGFLQAVKAVEHRMTSLVCDYLHKSKKAIDLFSGSGTFSLRLAERSRVHAVETEALALEALTAGSRTEGLKPVTTEQRDLFEAPLTAKELSRFDGVCLDPPRAGALDQIRELAMTDIKAVAYVSCNPTTLARDAAVLTAFGYEIDRVVPLDQFLFSPHVEVVTLFSKKNVRKQKAIFGRKV